MKNIENSEARNNYRKEKYKKHIINLKKECILFNQKSRKRSSNKNRSTYSLDVSSLKKRYDKIDETLLLIRNLDNEKVTTFSEEHSIDFEPYISYPQYFLYHGLRFQQKLEKLEGILKEGKILAGKYLNNYSYYGDNCNDGEYVSLARYSNCIEFKAYIEENVCLIISPLCEAYKTIHVTFNTWNYIKKHNIPVRNRFSYSEIEYQVKDFIPIEMVRAIGIPYNDILINKGMQYAEKYKQDIIDLLNKYNISLPIVDINFYNKIIYIPPKTQTKIKSYIRN